MNNEITKKYPFKPSKEITLNESNFFIGYEEDEREPEHCYILRNNPKMSVCTYSEHGQTAKFFESGLLVIYRDSQVFYDNTGEKIYSTHGEIEVGTWALKVTESNKEFLVGIEHRNIIDIVDTTITDDGKTLFEI